MFSQVASDRTREDGCGTWGHALVVDMDVARLTAGLDDLSGLFQLQRFCDFKPVF